MPLESNQRQVDWGLIIIWFMFFCHNDIGQSQYIGCLELTLLVQVGEELKAKVVQAAAAKVKKLSKKVEGKVGVKEVERDEFDKMAEDKQNVRQRINSGDKETKVKQRADSGSSKTKQTKLNFKPVEKKPKRNPWSDVDSDEDKSGLMMERLYHNRLFL